MEIRKSDESAAIPAQPTAASELDWRTSSFSYPPKDNCVELAFSIGDAALVRDSKNPEGPRLSFDQAALGALVGIVKRDQSSAL